MRAWWGNKSNKLKQKLKPHDPPETPPRLHSVHPSNRDNDIKRDTLAVDDKPRSSNELGLLNSSDLPRNSKEFGIIGCSSSGFSGFESDGAALPLPLPSTHLPLYASGYASVSSVSSSGSSDDHPLQDQVHFRANGENKVSTRSKSPCSGRVVTPTTVSPLHPQLSCSSFDSPTKKQQEDGKAHRLPLPPSSPTKPSSSAVALAFTKTSGVAENSGHIISKWKKGRILGRGTFGHVYLGFNNESGKFCAIKEVRLLSDDQSSKECLKQLNQEISLLSQLLHPNIVQYYGSELGDESLTVFLEYVSGGSIHRLLQEYGPFKEPVIQYYTRQILCGLAYLHGRNTVHRDIKGANILVGPNGEIKLADFGMAKHITACSSMLSFKGSPYWMAPEVVMNTNGYSLPVDIWSLGCTILEMAMAKPPWSQFEGVAAIFKIGNGKDLPEIPSHLSKDAQNFVKRCLNRDPLKRPAALELLDHPFMSGVAATSIASPFPIENQQPMLDSEYNNNRARNMASCERNYLTMPVASSAMKYQRESLRMISSLPVSPCGSPHKSFFLSPPRPPSRSSCSLNLSEHSVLFPTRPNNSRRRRTSLDVLHETSLVKR